LGLPESRKSFRRVFRKHETSLYRLHLSHETEMNSQGESTPWKNDYSISPKSHLCGPESRKFILSDCWLFQSWLSRHCQCRIFVLSEFREWVRRVGKTLETTLSRTQPSRILGQAEGWKHVLKAFPPHDIAFSTSPKSDFGTSWRHKMSSQGHSTTWNIASSTSSKSHFWMPWRQNMSSHGL
jgi:hypothetical protein